MRLLLFTGKGGVGKTTVAAATAVHAARSGVKTLVVSADAAHSLADAMAVPLGPGPDPAEVEPGLFAGHVDPRSRAGRSWGQVQGYLTGLLETLGVDPLAAGELTALPGVLDVLALLEVRDRAASGRWDLVVVDCAPTAETLRLLCLPEALTGALERMLPVEQRVLRAIAHGARVGRGRPRGVPLPADHVVEAAERLSAELVGVRESLTAPGASVRLVLTPEAVVVAEARRAWTTLSLFGYRMDAVVANRVIPTAPGDPWREGWARSQAERLAEVETAFAPIPVVSAPYLPREPVGPQALAALGEQLYGPAGAAAAELLTGAARVDPPVRVERDDAGFALCLHLPSADRSQVDLHRRADDLVVQLGGYRRVLALPSALRRCRVTGASLRDDVLRVRFEPDPDLWRPL